MAPNTIPIEERFKEKYRVDQESGCWIWTASLMPNGYAQFRYSRAKNGYGHRFSYEHHIGPIPEGRQIDHLCKNKACVNPDHLDVVTPKTNIERIGPRRSANAEKTHCPRGHPLSGDNLYVFPNRRARTCRTCRREYAREYYVRAIKPKR